MRKLFFLIALTSFLFSCHDKEPANYVVISGKVDNSNDENFSVLSRDEQFVKEISVNENGHFEDTLKINHSGTYMVAHNSGAFPIFLDKGYNLRMNYDTEDLMNSFTFSGDGSEFNQYMQDARGVWNNIQGEDIEAFYNLKREDYKEKILEIQEGQEQLLTSVTDIPDNLREKEHKNIGYFSLVMLQLFNEIHPMEEFLTRDFTDVFEAYSNMNYASQEDFEYSGNYKILIHNYYRAEAKNLAESEDLEDIQAFIITIKDVPNDKIRNFLLYNKVAREIARSDDLDGLYKQYMEISTNENFDKEITDSYNKLKKITSSLSSPKFVDYENHAGGETSLDDLKGDYVYLDIWATWCAPCLNEIPALKRLMEEYEDRDIKFVSISIDQRKDYEKWKQMVIEKDLKGVQLIADNAWQSDFIQDYQIQAIPRFILLDPNGNIITNRAPYPSDENLINIFDENGI